MSLMTFSNHARKHQVITILLVAMLVASIVPRVTTILQQPQRASQQLTTNSDDVIVQGCLSEKNDNAKKASTFGPVVPRIRTAPCVEGVPAYVKHTSYLSTPALISHLLYTQTTASHL